MAALVIIELGRVVEHQDTVGVLFDQAVAGGVSSAGALVDELRALYGQGSVVKLKSGSRSVVLPVTATPEECARALEQLR